MDKVDIPREGEYQLVMPTKDMLTLAQRWADHDLWSSASENLSRNAASGLTVKAAMIFIKSFHDAQKAKGSSYKYLAENIKSVGKALLAPIETESAGDDDELSVFFEQNPLEFNSIQTPDLKHLPDMVHRKLEKGGELGRLGCNYFEVLFLMRRYGEKKEQVDIFYAMVEASSSSLGNLWRMGDERRVRWASMKVLAQQKMILELSAVEPKVKPRILACNEHHPLWLEMNGTVGPGCAKQGYQWVEGSLCLCVQASSSRRRR